MDKEVTQSNRRIINLLWLGFEKLGLLLVSALSFFIFAIYLTPSELGLAVIAIIFAELISQFYCSLIENPLVRREAKNDYEMSSAFWFGGGIAFLSVLLVGCAYLLIEPNSSIPLMIIILSISVLFTVLSRPFIARLRYQRQFKNLAIRTVWGKLIGALIAIYAAMHGAGEWSLVFQLIAMNTVSFIILLAGDRRFISTLPSLAIFKSLWLEGLPIAFRENLNGLFEKAIVMILAVFTSPAVVGYFSFAQRLVDLPKQAVSFSLNTYTLPVFSERNQTSISINNFFIQISLQTLFIVIPLFLFYGIFGSYFIVEIFGEKWHPSLDYFIFFAFLAALQLITMYIPNLQIAYEASKIGLKEELSKVIFTAILAILLGYWFGVYGILFVIILDVILLSIIRFYSMKHFLKISINGLIFKSIGLFILTSIIGILAHFTIQIYSLSYLYIFAISLFSVLIYMMLSKVFFKLSIITAYEFVKKGK